MSPAPVKFPELRDRKYLAAKRKAGLSSAEIAAEIGCSALTLGHWLARHGLTHPRVQPRVAVRDGKPVLLKRCRACKRDRVCADGPESEFWVHGRKPNGKPTYSPLCGECMAKAKREERHGPARERHLAGRRARYAARTKNDPEWLERKRKQSYEATKRWLAKPENKEIARLASLRYHRRRREEDREAVNEEARMHYAMRKERLGEPVQRNRPTVIDGTKPRVPVEPFRDWLGAYCALRGLSSFAETAAELGTSEKVLSRVFAEEYARVSLDVVDRALQNADEIVCVRGRWIYTLEDLYPLKEAKDDDVAA